MSIAEWAHGISFDLDPGVLVDAARVNAGGTERLDAPAAQPARATGVLALDAEVLHEALAWAVVNVPSCVAGLRGNEAA